MRLYCKFMAKALMASTVFVSMTGCDDEKDDFIDEPTETSTIVSGKVTEPDGTPIPGIQVTMDYQISGLAGQFLKHKSKSVTDKNGSYRLIFEIADDKAGGNVLKNYKLRFDLSTLPSDKYLVYPSDFYQESDEAELTSYFDEDGKEGTTVTYNVSIPRKKMLKLKVKCEGGVDDNVRYAITNSVAYGGDWHPELSSGSDGQVTMMYPVEFTATGDGTVAIPCAIDALNVFELTMKGENDAFYHPISDRKEIKVTSETPEEMTMTCYIVPQECRFKIKKIKHRQLMDDEYPFPAPFDMVSIMVADGKDDFSIRPSYVQFYDSIVWSAEGLPDTYKVYRKDKDGDSSSEHFASYVGTYFYEAGSRMNYLTGYRGGYAVYADSAQITLYERDFLCFDWKNGSVSLTDYHSTVYNRLDTEYEYMVKHTSESDGTRYVEIRVPQKNEENEAAYLSRSRAGLRALLHKCVGEKVEADLLKTAGSFKCLPASVDPMEYYENKSTRIMILHKPETEHSAEQYYVHAESK